MWYLGLGATLHRHGTLRESGRCRPCEGDFGFLRGGEQVQDGVGRTAHRDVERHRVLEGFEGGDAERGRTTRRPLAVVPAMAQFDDEVRRRAGTGPCGRRAWPARCRCPAATGPALRSGSSSSWR
jgi:hypothetical protein